MYVNTFAVYIYVAWRLLINSKMNIQLGSKSYCNPIVYLIYTQMTALTHWAPFVGTI